MGGRSDCRALSPLISVALMLVVAVGLVAVSAVFLMGVGSDVADPTPNTVAETEYSEDAITVTHDGGDSLTPENTHRIYATGIDPVFVDWNTDVVDPDSGGDDGAVVTGQITSQDDIASVNNVAEGDEFTFHIETDSGSTTALLEHEVTRFVAGPFVSESVDLLFEETSNQADGSIEFQVIHDGGREINPGNTAELSYEGAADDTTGFPDSVSDEITIEEGDTYTEGDVLVDVEFDDVDPDGTVIVFVVEHVNPDGDGVVIGEYTDEL